MYRKYVDYPFTAGKPVPVVIEYRQRFRSSGVRILWKPSPGADHANRETAYTHIPTGNYLPPTDVEAPSIPESVHLTYLSPSRVQITWAPSSDDVAVLGYHISRDGQRVATVLHQSIWVDEGVDPSTSPVYTVEAIDWTGALSGPSAPAESWHGLSVTSSDISSHTNPVWIEERSSPVTQAVDLAIAGAEAIPALRLGPEFWGSPAAAEGQPLGLQLPAQTPTLIQVTAHGAQGQSDSLELTATWTPLIVSVQENPSTYALRVGDTLLLDVDEPEGTAVVYDVGDNGHYDKAALAGSPVTLYFDSPGIHTVRVMVDLNNDGVFDAYEETVTLLEVSVLSVDFDGPIACEVGFRREKGVAVHPLEAADTPVWDSNDPSLLEVAAIPDDQLSQEVLNNPNYNPANYGKRLWLTPTRRGTPVLLARTPSGAVIGYQEVDEFTQEIESRKHLIVNSASRVGTTAHIIRPYVSGLKANYDMFSSSSTFAGGQTQKVVSTDSFEAVYDPQTEELIGVLNFDIEVPEGEDSYCFRVGMDQSSKHGTTIMQPIAVNGVNCEVEMEQTVIWAGLRDGEGRETGFIRARLKPDSEVRRPSRNFDVIIDAGSDSGAGDPVFTASGNSRIRAGHGGFTCSNSDWQEFPITVNGNTGEYDIEIHRTTFEKRLLLQHVDISEFPEQLRIDNLNEPDNRTVNPAVTIRGAAGIVQAQLVFERAVGGQSGQAAWFANQDERLDIEIRDGFRRVPVRALEVTQDDNRMLAKAFLVGTRNATSEYEAPVLNSEREFEIVSRKIVHFTHLDAPDGTAGDRMTIGVGEFVRFNLGEEATYSVFIDDNRRDVVNHRGDTFSAQAGPRHGSQFQVVVQYDDEDDPRTLNFNVISPNGIKYKYIPDTDLKSIPVGVVGCVYRVKSIWYPMHVNFGNIEVRELSTGAHAQATVEITPQMVERNYFKFTDDDSGDDDSGDDDSGDDDSGDDDDSNPTHHKATERFFPIGKRGNLEMSVDTVGYWPPEAMSPPEDRDDNTHWPNNGFPRYGEYHRLSWHIPHEYRIQGSSEIIDANIVTEQRFVINSRGDLAVSKLGQHGSVARTRVRATGEYTEGAGELSP